MGASKTVWLVGMMGAGKTTVGQALACRMGCPWIDTDQEIERVAEATVAEIFEREGETGFRARERVAIDAVAGQPVVVSLGGGAMTQAGAPERLSASGTVVYLRARPETLLQRLEEGDTRPLLRGLDADARLARVRELVAARAPAYERAEIVVDTDDRAVADLVDTLERSLETTRS